tara:strand:- start:3941 stop:7810 length:3870 start_codon:yes stop_codon:yes gene_type:complete
MAVTERLMGTGSFDVSFSQSETPTQIVETIKEWGHIVLTANQVDINTLSDAQILSTARYTGIILNRSLEENVVSITGQGLQLYLGDGSSKGMVIAESKNIGKVRNYIGTTLAETLFNSTAQTNKPLGIMRTEAGNSQAITQGTVTNPAGTYTGSHFVQTALSALKEISEQLNTEYKINANGTIDAGPQANLFQGVNGNPSTIVVKSGYGDDPEFEGVVPQGLRTEFDATDFVSRVDFIGEVGYFDTATDVAGEANLGSNPYKDLHGNALTRVALVQEPDIAIAQLNNRATLMLNELSRVKKVLNLDLQQYEVEGDMRAGDFIFAFDPDIGFKDTATDAAAESRSMYEAVFRGQTITPVKVRVQGLTWPIKQGMGVYFRDKDGNYTDLTQYVTFESGSAQVELGDLLRFIGDDLRFSEFSLNQVTAGVFSIPDLPATPTLQSGSYQDSVGVDKGFIRVVLAKPTNEDGSQITDGSHYRVRYKKLGDAQYSYKDFPYTGANSESLLLQDLTIGYTYQVGVTVYDKSGFHKMSAYDGTGEDLYTDSSSVNASFATNARVEITKDGVAPSKPHTATIAAGALNVQISHYLRKAGTDGDGNPYGNFTLEGDIDYLAIHAVTVSGNSQNFTVATSNKIGEVRVTAGNLLQAIPVVATLELADSENYYFRIVAVDKSGNASTPSDGQTSAATLIAESHISDATITTAKIGDAQITNAKIADATIDNAKIANLNATKINAGTISADRIGADSITAAKIAANTITATEIAADTITATQIASGTITATEIASGTITTGQLNFTPATNSDLANYVTISSTSAGTLDIVADDVEITGNLSATGTITANAGFISGVAVEPSGVTSAITMDDLSSLISQLTASSGGTFRTASSGARVQISSASSTPIIEVFDSAGSVTGQIGYNSTADKIYMSGSATPINFVTTSAETPAANNTQSRITLSANVIDFESGTGSSLPYIRIGDVTQTNKYLTVDGSGKLAFSSASVTGGVTSITAAGELSLTGAGTGDVTITHADSDHDDRFYTKSTADILLGAKASSSHGTHVSSSTAVQTLTASGTSGSVSGDITISSNAGGGGFISGNPFRSGNTISINASINGFIGQATPTGSTRKIGISSSNRFNNIYSQSFFGTFYGQNINASSKNIKENIVDTDLGLDFINDLEVKDFTMIDTDTFGTQKYTGFIAEDIQKYLDDNDLDYKLTEDYSGNYEYKESCSHPIVPEPQDEDQTITYMHDTVEECEAYMPDENRHPHLYFNNFVGPLVKAVQELSAKVDSLTARIEVLEGG